MQKSQYIAGGVALALICTTIMVTAAVTSSKPIYAQVNGGGSDSKNNIAVSAEGKVTVKPDLATFVVGYTVKAKSLQEVQDQLEAKSNDLVAAIKRNGIEDKDITTIDYRVEPNYYWETSGKQTMDGHSGSVSIQVKVRDVKSVGKVIDNTMSTGANTLSSISFTVEDRTKFEDQARTKAAELAKDKAETLAKASGADLGGLLYITESVNNPYPYYNLTAMESKIAYDSVSAPSIQAGSFEVTVVISATYAIK